MPTDIYTLDSLKITVEDEYEDVRGSLQYALKKNNDTLEFTLPIPTTIVVNKISAIVKVK